MEGLSIADITALTTKRSKKGSTAKKGYAIVRSADGGLDKVPLDSVSSVGKFEGKAGTMRRSRKGTPRRLPNGTRFFAPNWETEVVSYRA